MRKIGLTFNPAMRSLKKGMCHKKKMPKNICSGPSGPEAVEVQMKTSEVVVVIDVEVDVGVDVGDR